MGRRELNPHLTRSQRGALSLSYNPQKNFEFRIANFGFLKSVELSKDFRGSHLSNPKSEFRNPKFDGARGEIRTHIRLILSQLPLPFGLHAHLTPGLVLAEGFEPTLYSF